MSDFARLVVFARERLEELPSRIHAARALADDGSPAWAREFSTWISSSPYALRSVETREPCDHGGKQEQGCESCAVFGEDGRVIANTGHRIKRATLYRWPARAALARMAKLPVPEGFPSLPEALSLAARVGFAPIYMVDRYPAVADEGRAARHALVALRRFKALYTAEPPVRWNKRINLDCD